MPGVGFYSIVFMYLKLQILIELPTKILRAEDWVAENIEMPVGQCFSFKKD
jgi:hypothetical protein